MTELTEGNDMSTDHGATGFCTDHGQAAPDVAPTDPKEDDR